MNIRPFLASHPVLFHQHTGIILLRRSVNFVNFGTMLRRITVGAATLLAVLSAAMPASAQPVSSPAPAPPSAAASKPLPHVALETSLGTIILRIEAQRAPITAANFLKYVDAKRYDGQTFYRTTRNWGEGSTVVQGGVRTDARLLYPAIAHEPTTATGLTHCPGAVSIARNAPGSARSDFFLLLSAIPGFDADPAAAGDNVGFAVFAEVVSGWEVAQKIAAAPVSDTLGEGIMKGQMLAAPVKIIRAARVPAPATPDPAKPKPGCVVKTP
jgi:peptidyl-prolyl cis-trans isomerase A (cyclophilin A)